MQPDASPERTIVVTGMGAVCGAGPDVQSLWRAVEAGRSPAQWLVLPDIPSLPKVAACAVDDAWLPDFPLKRYGRMDRSVHLAVTAAAQAFNDSGLSDQRVFPSRIGVALGTSRGPIHTTADTVERQRIGKPLAPCASAHTTIGCAAGAIAFVLGATGPSITVSATCASGAHAIINAAQQILCGHATFMIAGGTDAPLHPAVIGQMAATGVLGSHPDATLICRPFDRDRNGTMLGEGAGCVVLETLASARSRGARVNARITGWATGTDCHHETAPAEDGNALAGVISQALSMASRKPEDIDAINLHGTGTVVNDLTEAAAVKSALGLRAETIPSSSTKPITGHCLGATAAIEAIISILSIRHRLVPPNHGLNAKDADIGLNLSLNASISCDISSILSNSVGFWGNNAALLLESGDEM